MKKEILRTLPGIELFEYYTSLGGEYANSLLMAHLELGEELYPMLEQCERENKKIVITEQEGDFLDPPITITIH